MLWDFFDLGVLESSISHAEFVLHSRISFSNFLTFMYLDISSCALSFSRPQQCRASTKTIGSVWLQRFQRLLVNMWALLHFSNVSRLPLQVLSRMSSKFYCRSGWSGAMPIFPSSFNFIETWKDYLNGWLNPAGAAATGATWTTHCQIRHPLTIITTGIESATMY